MTDLVKKYQHYFNESVKLQETVNEQLAYITELEDAIISLDEAYGSLSECIKGCPDMDIDLRQQCKAECAKEFNEKQKGLDEVYRMTPERDAILKREKNKAQKDIDGSMERAYELSNEEEMTADEERQAAAAFARTHRISLLRMKTKPKEERGFAGHPDLKSSSEEQYDHNAQLSDSSLNKDLKKFRAVEKKNTVKEEVLELDETSKELKLRYILKASGADPLNPSKTRSGMGNNIPTAIRGLEDAAASRDEGDREHFQNMYKKRTSGIRAAIRALGKQQDTVQEATQADDEHGTVARVGRITKFLEKHPDPRKMKEHHLNHFFNHPDFFGDNDAASKKATKKLSVEHRKQIGAMRKDYDDLEW